MAAKATPSTGSAPTTPLSESTAPPVVPQPPAPSSEPKVNTSQKESISERSESPMPRGARNERELPKKSSWPWFVLAALLILGLALGAWFWWKGTHSSGVEVGSNTTPLVAEGVRCPAHAEVVASGDTMFDNLPLVRQGAGITTPGQMAACMRETGDADKLVPGMFVSVNQVLDLIRANNPQIQSRGALIAYLESLVKVEVPKGSYLLGQARRYPDGHSGIDFTGRREVEGAVWQDLQGRAVFVDRTFEVILPANCPEAKPRPIRRHHNVPHRERPAAPARPVSQPPPAAPARPAPQQPERMPRGPALHLDCSRGC